MCEGASKQSPDLKNYTATGPQPPFLNFWIRHWYELFIGFANEIVHLNETSKVMVYNKIFYGI